MYGSEVIAKLKELEHRLDKSIVKRCETLPTKNIGRIVIFDGAIYFWNGTTYKQLSSNTVTVVNTYSDLPNAPNYNGEFFWVENPQGTRWLPGSLGGTYYKKGLYYSNGITWETVDTPYQATQSEVDNGLVQDKFVTPSTLNSYSKWNTKFDSPTGNNTQYLDGAGTPTVFPTIPTKTSDLLNDGDDGNTHFISLEDLPANLILYPTTAASDIPAYFKLVTDIHDIDFNDVAVDINTGNITTTSQLISSLSSEAGIINGNPGVFNITVIGNIRRISGSGEANFYFQVYKRDITGTETLIGISDTTAVVNQPNYTEFSATALWDDGLFLSTDRVVLKFYANRISGGSNPAYQFQFGGTTPVRTLVPVSLSTIGYTKVETDNLLTNKRDLYTWEYLATKWSVEPTLNSTIIGGDVYNYTLSLTTRYRFVPSVYNPTQDAFYSNFDGTNLMNLITTRG